MLISSLTVLFVIVVILGIAWSFRRKRRQKKGNTYIIIYKIFFKIYGSQEKNSIQFGCLIYFRIQFCSQNYLEDIKWSLTCKGTSIKCLNKSRIVSFCFTSLYSNAKWALHKSIQWIWAVYRFPFFWWAIVIAVALLSRLSDELRFFERKLCFWIYMTTLSPSLIMVIRTSKVQFGR